MNDYYSEQFRQIYEGEGVVPFSNGSEAEHWMACNCDGGCVRSFNTRYTGEEMDGRNGEETEAQVRSGHECLAKYALDAGFLSGAIPADVAEWIGGEVRSQEGTTTRFVSLPDQCQHYSEDDRDNPDLRPAPADPRQTRLPFLVVELFGFADPDLLVFDTAIVEREVFETASGQAGETITHT